MINPIIENTNSDIPDISIIVLCYKAGRFAYDFTDLVIKEIEKNITLNFQIVLVGNYNHNDVKDETPVVVENIANKNKRVFAVAKPKEGMMGWDMRSGLEIATGRFIAVIDGDGQMPVEDLTKIYREIINKNADLAKTFRITRGDGLKRNILSFVYNIIFKILFPGLKITDINSKPKIISRKAYNKLQLTANDWFIDAEIMIQARRYKFKVVEIPAEFRGLVGRKSFVNFKTVFEFLKNLIVYRIKEFRL